MATETTVSLWHDRAARTATYDSWSGRQERYDVVVVGAGITGTVTALLLAERGLRVAIVEARDIGAVTTGNTTGKVSALQGTRLSQIGRRHSAAVRQGYIDGTLSAQRWVVDFCTQHGLDFDRADAYTYAVDPSKVGMIDAEYRHCRAAGLPAERVTDIPLPFPFRVAAAVTLPDQIQIDPMPLLFAAVERARASGAQVFVGRRVKTVDTDEAGCIVRTDDGDIRADRVVLATGIPILDRGGFFARLEPDRSYCIAVEVPGGPPEGMYLSADSPTRSLRTASAAGTAASEDRLLLVGGNGHVVGRHDSTRSAYDDLLRWSRQTFPGARELYRWSAQDYTDIDGLPEVGPILPGVDRIWVATGFGKWGMTGGVAAAQIIASRFSESRDHEVEAWAPALSSWRTELVTGTPTAVRLNATVAFHLAKGWWQAETSSGGTAEDGSGRVVRDCGRPVGVSTVGGRTTRVSAVCPHLGGILRWNDAESSWDCPLHGSRFTADGSLLEGPATSDLAGR
ncbi:FAD-dependent oxidoreductase [Rhodococcus sp. CH91]|uniref:FAD-dependent oxidoreductase n=1 Tax=Rhodococcus sp. CH91 TaxID=2910256 RepID=UPI001F4AB63B|nr:FAD-dependent oxidoreductase [Rhodococcus sp. CH91]